MHLLTEDIEKIGHILARRHFVEQGWQFTDLAQSSKKIIESLENVNEAYNKYPEMTRDWYVDNSAEKSFHMTTTWDELGVLVGLIQTCPDQFDFILKMNNNMSLCMVKTMLSDLNKQQQHAIAYARKAGFNVYIFKADIPDTMDFELDEVAGGISGIGIFS